MANRLLLCVDLSESDSHVIDEAITLAGELGATIELLHVVAPAPDFVGYTSFTYPGRDEYADELKHEKAALIELADRLQNSGVQITAYMKEAATVDGILEFAEKHDVRMIVAGCHSKGRIHRLLLGSVATDLAKRSTRPLLLVPPPPPADR